MQKLWNVMKYEEKLVEEYQKKLKISSILARLLISRNVSIAAVKDFLKCDVDQLSDPYKLKDMKKFVDAVSLAIEQKEKICIYGDYDVDGITSITILHQFLRDLGADVTYYLPDRLTEGYGLNIEAVDRLKKDGVSFLITVDCGVTAVDEIAYAISLGIKVCITDHHECAEQLPNAIAIVNPKQKEDKSDFKVYAGVGVAFKCMMALAKKYHLSKESYLQYMDIVALGTISDIVPLIGENRTISKFGLEMMRFTKNIGLKELLCTSLVKEIDSMSVSFSLAPRINACGRMGNAGLAARLLLCKEEKEAKELSLKLEEQNKLRQNVEKGIYEHAIQIIEKEELYKKSSIVLYHPDWHNGVIGIVASKLVAAYYKPVILFTKENGVVRGSGRCPTNFSLYETLVKCKQYLVQFGGHELAAGMVIEEGKIDFFKQAFDLAAAETMVPDAKEILDIDLEIKKEDLNVNLLKDILLLKPYGQCNKEPLFLYKNIKVHSISTIKEDKHLKLTLKDDKVLIVAIAFSQGNRRDEIKLGDRIDVVGNITLNTYTNPKTLQIMVKDFNKTNERKR